MFHVSDRSKGKGGRRLGRECSENPRAGAGMLDQAGVRWAEMDGQGEREGGEQRRRERAR